MKLNWRAFFSSHSIATHSLSSSDFDTEARTSEWADTTQAYTWISTKKFIRTTASSPSLSNAKCHVIFLRKFKVFSTFECVLFVLLLHGKEVKNMPICRPSSWIVLQSIAKHALAQFIIVCLMSSSLLFFNRFINNLKVFLKHLLGVS